MRGSPLMHRLRQCALLATFWLAIATHAVGRDENPDEAAAKARLVAKGMHVTHSGLCLSQETEFGKEFRAATTLKRKLATAVRELAATERDVEKLHENLHERMRANVDISNRLANGGANVFEHNQLVGAANANVSAINLLMQEQELSRKEVDRTRAAVNSAREKYVQQIVKLRGLADKIEARYAELKKDSEVQTALGDWNKAAKTAFEIKPSRSFQLSLKQLALLEKTVVTDKIPLRREGNGYFATVFINGQHLQEMVVDTGASAMVLPYRAAMECGVRIDVSAVPVQMVVASGARFKSKMVTLESVRVGKFTAQNVECVVLPPEATNAPLLLGMTFLGRFNFSINGTELVLSKTEADHPPAGAANKHAAKPPAKNLHRRDPDSSE